MYRSVIRPILFRFDPEAVHHFSFRFIGFISRIPGILGLLRWWYRPVGDTSPVHLFGLTFPNPVGLAAGFDKDALLTDAFAAFGFGFIEVGTLTPRPQPGNPKPRLFRLPEDRAIINRMGFNNGGAAAAADRLRRRTCRIPIGGNIGKNKDTPNDQALDDYLRCIRELQDTVDYFVVNVSSPNTPGLRELQEKEPLRKLLEGVCEATRKSPTPRPVLLKIAPDLTDEQLEDIVGILKSAGVDGVIATNTTVDRTGLKTPETQVTSIGAGGLSGSPVAQRSNQVIRFLRARLGPGFPIIGVGGIMTPEDAQAKFEAGADLIQVYTGFVYHGPSLVRDICRGLSVSRGSGRE